MSESASLLRILWLVLLLGSSAVLADEPSSDAGRPEELECRIGELTFRIDGHKRWTLSGINFQGEILAVPESAYGTVVNIRGVGAFGSAHFLDVPGQPGAVEQEPVDRLEFRVDDRPVTEFKARMLLTGTSFSMIRESRLRALHVTSQLTVKEGLVRETVRLRTAEAVDLRFACPMMYAFSPATTHYLLGDAKGVVRRGTFLGKGQKAVEGQDSTARWVAVYDMARQKGAVWRLVRHPPRVDLTLQSTDAPDVYRKFRLLTFLEKPMPANFDGTFESAVTFFTAVPEMWEATARDLVDGLQ